jgi:hypothetical protein
MKEIRGVLLQSVRYGKMSKGEGARSTSTGQKEHINGNQILT